MRRRAVLERENLHDYGVRKEVVLTMVIAVQLQLEAIDEHSRILSVGESKTNLSLGVAYAPTVHEAIARVRQERFNVRVLDRSAASRANDGNRTTLPSLLAPRLLDLWVEERSDGLVRLVISAFDSAA